MLLSWVVKNRGRKARSVKPMLTRTLVALCGLAFGGLAQNALTDQEKKDGFQLLFDGKTMDHWHTVKRRPSEGAWTVGDGILSYQKHESWLATDNTYYDFVLRLEYKTAEKTDSGIFINASGTGNPGTTGVEWNINGDAGEPATARSSGALWSIVAPAKNMTKPGGEWNQVEIRVISRKLTAVWNGEKVLEVSLDDPQYPAFATRGQYGHIGLQAHAFGEPAAFRNIRIKPIKLGPPDPADNPH
jgi:hypothetical protein